MGSEMCIRDRVQPDPHTVAPATEALWVRVPDGWHLYLVLHLRMQLPVVLLEPFAEKRPSREKRPWRKGKGFLFIN